MENIAGEQTLLTSNIFPYKPLYFCKNSNSNNNSLLNARGLKLGNFATFDTLFSVLLSSLPFLMIDKVTWPCHHDARAY